MVVTIITAEGARENLKTVWSSVVNSKNGSSVKTNLQKYVPIINDAIERASKNGYCSVRVLVPSNIRTFIRSAYRESGYMVDEEAENTLLFCW